MSDFRQEFTTDKNVISIDEARVIGAFIVNANGNMAIELQGSEFISEDRTSSIQPGYIEGLEALFFRNHKAVLHSSGRLDRDNEFIPRVSMLGMFVNGDYFGPERTSVLLVTNRPIGAN